jgi:cell division topological specificity factor
MSFLSNLFRKRDAAAHDTALVAKERLQIVLAHERASRTAPDFLPMLQHEIMQVVAKYLDVTDEAIKVQLDRVGDRSVLEINVEMDRAKIKSKRSVPPEPLAEASVAVKSE